MLLVLFFYFLLKTGELSLIGSHIYYTIYIIILIYIRPKYLYLNGFEIKYRLHLDYLETYHIIYSMVLSILHHTVCSTKFIFDIARDIITIYT